MFTRASLEGPATLPPVLFIGCCELSFHICFHRVFDACSLHPSCSLDSSGDWTSSLWHAPR